MKDHHHSNNRHLPQSSPCDHASLVCDHRSAMKEIAREQSLVTQLRAIVLPALQADERFKLVAQMFQNILHFSSKAIAELQLHQSDARADDVVVDDKNRVRKMIDDCTKEKDVKSHHQHKRRRFTDSVSLETPVPHYDGRQWRKYGQKHINKAKHPRSYYRCTYKQEQDCRATKTVQQQDSSFGADHPLMYTVVYHGQHTCKGYNSGGDSGTDDAETNTQSSSDLVQSDSQCSISMTCSDHSSDYQASLDDTKLLSTCEDLTAENMYEPFEMTAFASLDRDSWGLDALVKFGA